MAWASDKKKKEGKEINSHLCDHVMTILLVSYKNTPAVVLFNIHSLYTLKYCADVLVTSKEIPLSEDVYVKWKISTYQSYDWIEPVKQPLQKSNLI